MNNILGSKTNPFDWATYESMNLEKEWKGGWVQTQNLSETLYITQWGHVERKHINDEIGSELNPFSSEAYSEMINKGYWPGGYIKYSDTGHAFYKPCRDGYGDLYTSGSNNGCVTGSGENQTIEAGCKRVQIEDYDFTLTWSKGIADISESSASLSVMNLVGGREQIDYMEVQWYAPFKVIVYIRTGSGIEYMSTVNVP